MYVAGLELHDGTYNFALLFCEFNPEVINKQALVLVNFRNYLIMHVPLKCADFVR